MNHIYLHPMIFSFAYLILLRDLLMFLYGVPGIQRTGISLWWVPITGSTCRKHTH
ncbi:unnamed protein product [Staurois parvus]|uniref:Uncharacterized protein n=1 Tax=Staurois parvus TaxID=386267 RepID=A0ABN9CF77_9NEOB|nr:unnamed protein product [Staurois parvus]